MNKREHILNVMEELFQEGKAGTASVSDLAKRANIAKGGMYYYFRSKEEVMDALIERKYSDRIEKCRQSIAQCNEGALAKISVLFHTYATSYIDPSMDVYLHMPKNAALHQKSLTTILLSMSELLAQLISLGVTEEVFTCDYPLEYARIILSTYTFLLDPGLFPLSPDAYMRTNAALIDFIEKGLGCPKLLHNILQSCD